MRLRRPQTLLSEAKRCALIRVTWRTLQRTPRHLVKQRVKKSVAQQQLDHAGSVLRIIIPELGAHSESTLRLANEGNSKYSTSHCKPIPAHSRKLPNDTEKKPTTTPHAGNTTYHHDQANTASTASYQRRDECVTRNPIKLLTTTFLSNKVSLR